MTFKKTNQEGFTAVELLITLFIAAAFLVSGYQLYSVVIKDGGKTRAQARASNVAYDYLRRYSTSATNPCSPSTPLTDSAISISGLASVTVSISISCPYSDLNNLSKVEATVKYNNPQEIIKYSTFTDKGVPDTSLASLETGLVAWWKFNGNANDSAGSYNGTIYGPTLSTGQNGESNGSYYFNGSSQYIDIPDGMANFTSGLTMSIWINPTTSANYSRFIDFGNGSPSNNILFNRVGTTDAIQYYDTVGAFNTPNTISNDSWHNYVATHDTSGNAIIYKDGEPVGSSSFGLPANVTRVNNYLGRSNWASDSYYAGYMDDVRIYNRVLSASEISSLYLEGAN